MNMIAYPLRALDLTSFCRFYEGVSVAYLFNFLCCGQSRDTGNTEHKKANKNAINNGQSRDTGNIEHKKANKNAINNGQSRDTGNIEPLSVATAVFSKVYLQNL
jgi:hypothetical protein